MLRMWADKKAGMSVRGSGHCLEAGLGLNDFIILEFHLPLCRMQIRLLLYSQSFLWSFLIGNMRASKSNRNFELLRWECRRIQHWAFPAAITGLLRKVQEPEPSQKCRWIWNTGEGRSRGPVSIAGRTHEYHEPTKESQVQTWAHQGSQEGAGKV